MRPPTRIRSAGGLAAGPGGASARATPDRARSEQARATGNPGREVGNLAGWLRMGREYSGGTAVTRRPTARRHAGQCRRVALRPSGIGPGALGGAELLEDAGELEDAGIVEAAADDLDADGEAAVAGGPVDRGGGLLGHVEWNGEGDVGERVVRVVAGGGQLGLVGEDRGDRGEDVVVWLAGGDGGVAEGHDLVVGLDDVAAGELRGAPGAPLGDEGQDGALPLGGEGGEVAVQAGLEEAAHAIGHLGGEERGDVVDGGAGATI